MKKTNKGTLNKVQRSNLIHKKLEKLNLSRYEDFKPSRGRFGDSGVTYEQLMDNAKVYEKRAKYHDLVQVKQKQIGRVFSRSERQKIFNKIVKGG